MPGLGAIGPAGGAAACTVFTQYSAELMRMEMDEISRGWSVFSEDGKRVGDVVEVHPHYLLVSRGLFVVRDLYVPRYAVAAAEDRKVRLAITEERLRHMGWTSPPPPPPDVDTSSPHLVPTY